MYFSDNIDTFTEIITDYYYWYNFLFVICLKLIFSSIYYLWLLFSVSANHKIHQNLNLAIKMLITTHCWANIYMWVAELLPTQHCSPNSTFSEAPTPHHTQHCSPNSTFSEAPTPPRQRPPCVCIALCAAARRRRGDVREWSGERCVICYWERKRNKEIEYIYICWERK